MSVLVAMKRMSMAYKRKQAFYWYLAALFVMTAGLLLAAHHFPDGFDWPYTVASALMSQKHNPMGSFWFSVSMTLSMVLLWPYVSSLQQGLFSNSPRTTRRLINVIRIGLISGMCLGVERLLIVDLSHWFYKAHESVALLTIVSLYFGIIGLLIQSRLQQRRYRFIVLLVVILLFAVSLNLLWLYLTQRELGWVDTSWREKGIPVWLSFAFWQWWIIAFLWLGLGLLNYVTKKD